jgi:hypothetical protein
LLAPSMCSGQHRCVQIMKWGHIIGDVFVFYLERAFCLFGQSLHRATVTFVSESAPNWSCFGEVSSLP